MTQFWKYLLKRIISQYNDIERSIKGEICLKRLD